MGEAGRNRVLDNFMYTHFQERVYSMLAELLD
jgi:hypothetical protein